MISTEDGHDLATHYNAGFFETSALSGLNVNAAFEFALSQGIQVKKTRHTFGEVFISFLFLFWADICLDHQIAQKWGG